MNVQVMRDTPDITDPAHAAPPREEADAAPASSVRRFELDPASSPMLLAALAWDAAPRR